MKALALGVIVISALAVSALLDSGSGVSIWRELRADLGGARARVARLEKENEALRQEIATLESHPGAIDRAIREELDVALPGEIVVRFVGPDSRE